MHVALVAGINPMSPRASGIRSHVIGLATSLSHLGHEVRVVGKGPASADGLSFRFQSVCADEQASSVAFFRNLVLRRGALGLDGAVLHAHRPDDLAAFLWLAGPRARVLTVHGMSERGIHDRHGRTAAAGFRALERIGVRSADRILVLDPATREELTRRYPLASGRVIEVPAGVDLDRFYVMSRSESRRTLGIPDVPTVAFVGRLAPEKNLLLVLDAVAAIGVAQLLIAGDGPLRGLIERASFPRTKVHFLGPVEHSRIPVILNAADALVLPSHREGMPSVVLEALACGTPVVATSVGGLAGLVRDGINGYLALASVEEFARGLLQAVERSETMRAACRSSVEEFGWDRVAARLTRIYEEAGS